MALAKKKTSGLATLLIQDRFGKNKRKNKNVQRSSITEFSGLSKLNEQLDVNGRVITNSKEVINTNDIASTYSHVLNALDFTKCIPPRVPYNDLTKNEYSNIESYVFNFWKRLNKELIFERNIEIWRQFWITCERAQTIIQIIDFRNPEFFLCSDVFDLYPKKKHVVFVNKADLYVEGYESSNIFLKGLESKGVIVYKYSSSNDIFDFKLEGVCGMIGYPNVGKSSTINMIVRTKKVKVSSTPGKTKYIQTIETPQFTLLDCPGLVFPCHSKIDLILHSILNIDQTIEIGTFSEHIIDFIGSDKIRSHYGISCDHYDILEAFSFEKGWVKSKCLKIITKDFAAGNISYFG